MNANYIQLAATDLKKRLPDNHGFILLTVPTNNPNSTVRYISDLERKDAINLLKTWLIKASGEEVWMKHIN